MPESPRGKLLVIQGPTASGKTALAVALGKYLNTEVISADSRQFYHELQIGTARPSLEELNGVPHHFLGSHSLFQPLTAASYGKEALQVAEKLIKQHRNIILVGGSGLFIDALCKGFDNLPHDPELKAELNQQVHISGLDDLLQELQQKDPNFFQQVDRQNPTRVIRAIEVIRITKKPYSEQRTHQEQQRPFDISSWVINLPREILYQRINDRVSQMMEAGLEEEALRFYEHRQLQTLRTVGYQEFYDALQNQEELSKVPDLIRQHTRNYAKRQLTWFRRDPRNQWLGAEQTNDQLEEIKRTIGF